MSIAEPVAATRSLDDLPSPKGLPMLGHLLALDPKRLHLRLEAWSRELGDTYTIRMGPRRIYVTADAGRCHAVLHQRPHQFRRMRQIEQCTAELGSAGLFSVEGQAWKPQRQVVMEALNATHFRSFFPIIRTITERLLRRWQAAAAAGRTIEMSKDLVLFTVDVTTALAFGEDPNTLEREGDVIQDHLALVFPMLMTRLNAPVPYWRYVKLPQDRKLDRALAAIATHVDRLIANARRRLQDEPDGAPRNVLESLLMAAAKEGAAFDDAVVRANVMTLLLAGEDTTAHTLAWTMYYLCTRPEWQDRLREQVRGVLGEAPLPQTLEQVRALDLLESAANEALRLRPIAPLLFIEPIEDVLLDGVALPAGTPMFFVLRPAMLDERNFGEPHDYRPDRWAPGHALGNHEPRTFMQFGSGPRVCPGRHLAAVEIRMVLAMLVQQFRLELVVPPESIQEVLAFTLVPSRMPVRLLRRA
jgi:cytochrome P450